MVQRHVDYLTERREKQQASRIPMVAEEGMIRQWIDPQPGWRTRKLSWEKVKNGHVTPGRYLPRSDRGVACPVAIGASNGDTLSATLSLTALRRNLAKVRSTYLHFLLGGELIASYHPSPLHPPGVGMEQ
jgi:hypothetical protein